MSFQNIISSYFKSIVLVRNYKRNQIQNLKFEKDSQDILLKLLDHRRKGLARKLIQMTIDLAKSKSVDKLYLGTYLEIMKPAWTLYEQLGFIRTKEEVIRAKPRIMTRLEYVLNLEK